MILSEVQARVLQNVGDPLQQIWTSDRLNRFIDDTVQEVSIAAETARPELFCTTASAVASTGFHSTLLVTNTEVASPPFSYETWLPADYRRMISLVRTTGVTVKAEKISVDQDSYYHAMWDEVVATGDRSGEIHFYVRQSAVGAWVLGIVETDGTETFRLVYVTLLDTIGSSTSGTTVFKLPDEYQYLIVAGSSMRLLMSENRDPSMYQAIYDRGLALMGASLSERHGSRSKPRRETE